MKSIKTKITGMTVGAIVVVMIVAMISGVIVIRDIGIKSVNRSLILLCETGQKNLNEYFNSVEQSVEMVSAFVESDLNEVDKLDDKELKDHVKRVDEIFQRITYKTNGICTYYYRLDPAVSKKVKGFWYVNANGKGFNEHKVTDLSLYDENSDKSGLVWFTVPKETGNSVWLPPYYTENLNDVCVISYNVPVYYKHEFIGVIGIEIDYTTMAEQVDNIKLYESGYAFLNDADGKIIYHPLMDVLHSKDVETVPEGMLSKNKFVTYEYEGVKKLAAWLPLENGMRLYVTVPENEVNKEWMTWAGEILLIFLVLLIIFVFLIKQYTNSITRPLTELAHAAQKFDEGDYNVELEYKGDDEVGTLTRTFNKMAAHLRTYISDLNDLAYADSLTSVHNRGAFDIYVKKMQTQLEDGTLTEFAVIIFDCNRLKLINDQNGHEKGDIYLKETVSLICDVFAHSPVFRIGGDEFAAVLQGDNYEKRDELINLFDERCADKRHSEEEVWKEIDVARGLAVYDPDEDESVNDVVRRADKIMYENKWSTEGGAR